MARNDAVLRQIVRDAGVIISANGVAVVDQTVPAGIRVDHPLDLPAAQSEAEAREALESMLDEGVFGDAGRTVVVEEGLTGPEVTSVRG